MELTGQIKEEYRKELNLEDFHIIDEICTPEVLSLLALYFKSQGLAEKGFSLLVSGIKKAPERWELYDLLVFLSIKAGKTDDAEKMLLRAGPLFPKNPKVLASLGKLYFSMKNFTRAKRYLDKSIKRCPTEGINYLYLVSSRLALRLGKESGKDNDFPVISGIQKELQKFKELNPEFIKDDFLKGEELLSRGDYGEALESFLKVLNGYLEEKTEFTRFHKLLFSFYFEPVKLNIEELKKRIHELEEKIKYSSISPEGLNHLGYLYLIFFISLVKSAEEQFKEALILDSRFEAASKSKKLLEIKIKEILELAVTVTF